MTHNLVALIVLFAFGLSVSACTAYKARDPDPNGGGGAMFRSAQAEKAH